MGGDKHKRRKKCWGDSQVVFQACHAVTATVFRTTSTVQVARAATSAETLPTRPRSNVLWAQCEPTNIAVADTQPNTKQLMVIRAPRPSSCRKVASNRESYVISGKLVFQFGCRSANVTRRSVKSGGSGYLKTAMSEPGTVSDRVAPSPT